MATKKDSTKIEEILLEKKQSTVKNTAESPSEELRKMLLEQEFKLRQKQPEHWAKTKYRKYAKPFTDEELEKIKENDEKRNPVQEIIKKPVKNSKNNSKNNSKPKSKAKDTSKKTRKKNANTDFKKTKKKPVKKPTSKAGKRKIVSRKPKNAIVKKKNNAKKSVFKKIKRGSRKKR